ncbi:MAG: response regulator [Thiobacillus sp.]
MKKNGNDRIEILIAEDSPTQAEQLKQLLEEHKYKVATAPNGKAALAQLELHHPALVISDVMMPELDGYGLCKAIKSDEKLKHIPVMLVTTLSDPDDVIRGLECGADNFIRKPYDETYLLSRIKYLLMNVELRKNQRMQMALEIDIGGHKHFITAERQQILDLLVSTYEQAVHVNSELKEREKELAHANQVLQGLNRIAEGLNSADSERGVAEMALQRALELPGIQAGWVSLRTGEADFRIAAACGLPPALNGPDAFEGNCACRHQLLNGALASSVNIIKCERLAKAKGETLGLCCHASIPLWLGDGRALGVMNLAGHGNRLFSEAELKVLHSVGNQVAVALERARLQENLEMLVAERTAKLAAEVEERKQAEEALRASEARLRAIIEAEPECVKVVDAEGRIVQMNAAGLAMIDADRFEQVQGHKMAEFVAPERRAAYRVFAQKVLQGRPGTFEFEVTSFKGRHLWFDTHAVPLRDQQDSRPQMLAITRDITERKQAEAALLQINENLEHRVAARTADLERARREAEDANRAKSAFLATMSHEIRTPMNGVIGMVDVLAQSRLSEHQADLASTIRESAGSLLGIIDDILDFSKIEAGRLELEREPVCVADLVEGLCNSLVPVAARKGVELALFVAPEIPERVLSDDVRLRQVLYNLLGNAIKFSAGRPGKRGRVSVRVEVEQTAPLRLVLRVADNGIGMTAETVAGLFTPFTQAEISTTRRFGGTGLGLTICKRLVDLMQGEITVESTLGAGSTFTVSLPFERAAEQPLRSQPDLSGLDCIVLESPNFHAGDLRAYLEHAGARVHLASDAAAAARLAAPLAEPVVVILEAGDGTNPSPLAALPNLRPLLITRGRRRRARVEQSSTVTLDGDALRRQALLRAVAVAVGRASPEIFQERSEKLLAGDVEPPTIAEARAQGRLILVVEDDEINQKVILRQLALLGYAAEIAGNGVEALRLWREGRYALLLTDLHMPEMDGYTLADTIRHEEAGRSRIPILALTANALRGEANRARAAGLDEYMTKPVQLSALRSMLEKWMPQAAGLAASVAPRKKKRRQKTSVLDIAVLEALVGDDPATVNEFLTDYLASSRLLATEMRAALAAGDSRQVGAIAHKLKSSSRAVGALVLGDLCAGLENLGKTGDQEAIAQGIAKFDASLAKVEAEIAGNLAGSQ